MKNEKTKFDEFCNNCTDPMLAFGVCCMVPVGLMFLFGVIKFAIFLLF